MPKRHLASSNTLALNFHGFVLARPNKPIEHGDYRRTPLQYECDDSRVTSCQFWQIFCLIEKSVLVCLGLADKLKELPQAYAAIKTIADVLNAGDVGDDEVVAKAAAEDVWTRGKRALLAFAHRGPAEAPKEQPDDDDDNTGFLERIRGAGKRLVG